MWTKETFLLPDGGRAPAQAAQRGCGIPFLAAFHIYMDVFLCSLVSVALL